MIVVIRGDVQTSCDGGDDVEGSENCFAAVVGYYYRSFRGY